MSKSKTIWFDFDNTPHVQYLLPLAIKLSSLGCRVIYTAKDYSQTVPLLESRNVPFKVIGSAFGARKISKIMGTFSRAIRLCFFVGKEEPIAAFSSSRSCALASYLMRIPSFVFCDYEHVELSSYRYLGAFLVAPDVIPRREFEQKGFSSDHILSFPGFKEDISLFAVDLDTYQPIVESDLVTVLMRPPAQEGHYFLQNSLSITNETIKFLSNRKDVLLILSPRYKYQTAMLSSYAWYNDPIVLTKPVPFISLFKSVDLVISSGGTMLREAAVLGVPAYSILSNQQGAVDMCLERAGCLTFISDSQEVTEKIKLVKRNRNLNYRRKPEVIDFIIKSSLKQLDLQIDC